MQCPSCKKNIIILTNRLTPRGWKSGYYCEECGLNFSEEDQWTCPDCGTSLKVFTETGMAGCGKCYEVFTDSVLNLLRRSSGVIPLPDSSALQYWDPLAGTRTMDIREFTEEESSPVFFPVTEDFERAGFLPDFRRAGKDTDIFLGIRIRMARNIRGLVYPHLMTESQNERLAAHLISRGSAVHRAVSEFEEISGSEAFFLKGSFPWFLKEPGIRFAAVYNQGRFSVYTGEEDHLRAQWFLPLAGLDQERPDFREELKPKISRGMDLMLRIHSLYLWQSHSAFGFLTASPANTGTGFRISVLLHLPVLLGDFTEKASWTAALKRQGFEIRGGQGEGSPVQDIVQISDRILTKETDLKKAAARVLLIAERMAAREKKLRTLP